MSKAYRSDHDDGPKFSTSNNCPSDCVVVRNEEGPTGSSLDIGGVMVQPSESVCVREGAVVIECEHPKYTP